MARIRSIKPEFWTDEKIVALSPRARLLFIGMWNFVDDYGRSEYSPVRLKMQILPADSVEIGGLLGEIEEARLIIVYAIDNKEYFEVRGFTKHQKVDKRSASRIPPPPQTPPNSPEPSRKNPLEKEGIKEGIEESSLRSPKKSENGQHPDPSPAVVLEVVLDHDRAAAVVEHRKKLKKPLTAHAAKLLREKFAAWPDPNAAADEMIARGWQGFDPAWMENKTTRQTGPPGQPAGLFRHPRDGF